MTASVAPERLDGSGPEDKPRFRSVKCPMPLCGADLYITWHSSRPVWTDDNAADLSDPRGGYTSSWEVGCTEGHVVLLPPDTAADSYTFGECDTCDDPHNPDQTNASCCGHGDLDRLRTIVEMGPTDLQRADSNEAGEPRA
jgi:hypothetical protein